MNHLTTLFVKCLLFQSIIAYNYTIKSVSCIKHQSHWSQSQSQGNFVVDHSNLAPDVVVTEASETALLHQDRNGSFISNLELYERSEAEEAQALKQTMRREFLTSANMDVSSMLFQFKKNPIIFFSSFGNYNLEPHEDFVLFRESDIPAWIAFTIIFIVLIVIDNVYIFKENQVLSMNQAIKYVAFYVMIAIAFAFSVFLMRGKDQASNWMTGYILEWMLSVDNLFVFRMVFDIYGCPDDLKHKPLFYGIVGAIFFRMVFFVIGESLIHTIHYMHIVFGGFLVYTGIKIAQDFDEDEDPTQHPIIVWLSSVLPMVHGYDSGGRFFVRVKRQPDGTLEYPKVSNEIALTSAKKQFVGNFKDLENSDLISDAHVTTVIDENNPLSNQNIKLNNLSTSTVASLEGNSNGSGGLENKSESTVKVWESRWYNTPISSPLSSARAEEIKLNPTDDGKPQYEWRCTFLFIVVVCLEVTDLMFAVDSVSAIVAQIPDLYLAYTACIFAMLGLRATFFVIDELMRMFSYLKYAVAFMLVFIGIKLVISKVVHIPSLIVCLVLCCTLSLCIGLSMWKNQVARDSSSDRSGNNSPKGDGSDTEGSGNDNNIDGSLTPPLDIVSNVNGNVQQGNSSDFSVNVKGSEMVLSKV